MSIPARVTMKGGIRTYAIQNAWKAPMRIPIANIASTVTMKGALYLVIRIAPTAPVKQTTEPTERSMLPPVSMQSSIPVARMNTYAFCEIRFDTFIGRRIAPPVRSAKNPSTRMSTMIIVYFLTRSSIFVLSIF